MGGSIAGGETVAAFLAAVTFYLCKSPSAMRKLHREIRSHFDKYGDIVSSRALQLPYLQAVISEGLRIYPPSPQGLPRTSPGAVVDGVWVPPGVRSHRWVRRALVEWLIVLPSLDRGVYQCLDGAPRCRKFSKPVRISPRAMA